MNKSEFKGINNEGKLQRDSMLWKCVSEHIEANMGYKDTNLATEREDIR